MWAGYIPGLNFRVIIRRRPRCLPFPLRLQMVQGPTLIWMMCLLLTTMRLPLNCLTMVALKTQHQHRRLTGLLGVRLRVLVVAPLVYYLIPVAICPPVIAMRTIVIMVLIFLLNRFRQQSVILTQFHFGGNKQEVALPRYMLMSFN